METICHIQWKFKKSNEIIRGWEYTHNPNICTVGINPKEYFEKLKNRKIKKHKGVRSDTSGMNFESYGEIISSLRQIDSKRNKKKACPEKTTS